MGESRGSARRLGARRGMAKVGRPCDRRAATRGRIRADQAPTGGASDERQELSRARCRSQVGASSTGGSGEAKRATWRPDGRTPACNIYVAFNLASGVYYI
jgi:hypothetical protein